jgi:hypothetical protein
MIRNTVQLYRRILVVNSPVREEAYDGEHCVDISSGEARHSWFTYFGYKLQGFRARRLPRDL